MLRPIACETEKRDAWFVPWRGVSPILLCMLTACQPASFSDEQEEAPLGELLLVVHGNSSSRDLTVSLEKLEPDGCQEEGEGCAWGQPESLHVELVPASGDTWSGTLETVPAGSYRLEASATIGGQPFGTADKVPVQVAKRGKHLLHLLLAEKAVGPNRVLPHFVAVLLDGHPVEPGGTLTIEVSAGSGAGPLELRATTGVPQPQSPSTCPSGACSPGAFTTPLPVAFDPSLPVPEKAIVGWKAPAYDGTFHHPIELELRDAKSVTATIRFIIQVETPCIDECGGVCVDLSTDPLHCGTCGNSCPALSSGASTPYCGAGICNGFVSATAGFEHSCAITGHGRVACWGRNQDRQLGLGLTTEWQLVPQLIGNQYLTDVSALAAGSSHTCALLGAGTIKCWGLNSSGQLGDNSTTNRPLPTTQVAGISTATSIAAGGNHSCAILANGNVRCWGANGSGQLGDNSITNRRSPITVAGLPQLATRIALGSSHSCAILQDKSVWCWGNNASGQLGDNKASGPNSPSPVQAQGISTAIAVAAGNFHSCAVLSDGTARCWGNNSNGQLGDGTTVDKSIPTAVGSLGGLAERIRAGAAHTCAELQNNGPRCWGYNIFGQVGNNTSGNTLSSPVATHVISNSASLATGGYHTCATINNGSTYCWGVNSYGQIGNGERQVNKHVPTLISW